MCNFLQFSVFTAANNPVALLSSMTQDGHTRFERARTDVRYLYLSVSHDCQMTSTRFDFY